MIPFLVQRLLLESLLYFCVLVKVILKCLSLESTEPVPEESSNSSASQTTSNNHATAEVDLQIENQQPEDQTQAHDTLKQDKIKSEIVEIESKIT